MTISFFGHREVFNEEQIYQEIYKQFSELAKNSDKLTCYSGGYSKFDKLCVRALLELNKQFNNIYLIYVSPYLSKSHLKSINREIYNEIIYPPIENVPGKFAILKRNEWIIDNSDLIFFYAFFSFGGAVTALKYATRKNKKIIDIAKMII